MKQSVWCIVGLSVVAVLAATGMWANIGNGSISETDNSRHIRMLPGVDENALRTAR
jgi:hypothetical protein